MQLQNKATAHIQAALQGESFKDEANIEESKDKAIEETVNYFVKKHGITPDKNELRKMLSNENDYIETQLIHNSDLIKRGRKNELINELEIYITESEIIINKIRHNEGGYTTNSKPIKVVDEFCQLVFYYLFHTEQIIKINNPEATGNPIPPKETTEQKIKRILEPLRQAFDTPGHIDIIIDAFIKLKAGENLPKVNKAILYNMGLKEFIKPFGRLFADGLFKQGAISQTLLFYIEKNTISGNPEYSELYLNKELSNCKKQIDLTENNRKV